MANGARYDIRVEWKRNGVVYISIECIFQLPPYALIPKWFHEMAGGEWLMCDKQYMNQYLKWNISGENIQGKNNNWKYFLWFAQFLEKLECGGRFG